MTNHGISGGTILTAGNTRVKFTMVQDDHTDSPLTWGQDVTALYWGSGNVEGAEDIGGEENLHPTLFDLLPSEHREFPAHTKYTDVETVDGVSLARWMESEHVIPGYQYCAEDVAVIFDELEYHFWEELSPKVSATWENFADFATAIFGQPTAAEFIQNRVDACLENEVLYMAEFSTPSVDVVIISAPDGDNPEFLAEYLRQYLDGEVYYCAAVVEKVCDCCGTWEEIAADGLGGVYEPGNETIAHPWSDHVLPEIAQHLPKDFWTACE